MVRGSQGQRGSAEIEPKVTLSMERKIVKISKESEGFEWSGCRERTAGGQKLSLEGHAGWGGRAPKHQRKKILRDHH